MIILSPLHAIDTIVVTPSEDEHLRFFVDQFCMNENTTLGEILERLMRCRETQAVSIIRQTFYI